MLLSLSLCDSRGDPLSPLPELRRAMARVGYASGQVASVLAVFSTHVKGTQKTHHLR